MMQSIFLLVSHVLFLYSIIHYEVTQKNGLCCDFESISKEKFVYFLVLVGMGIGNVQ